MAKQVEKPDDLYATEVLTADAATDPSSPDIDEKDEKYDGYVKPSEPVDVDEAKLDDFINRDEKYDWDSEEFRDIPEIVRNTVSFEDDPTLPVITFRAILLSAIFCTIGSVISQISYFRTTTAAFPVFFVILASHPLGKFLAKVLPAWTVPLGRFSFNLNPGPFSVKEHVIIGIAANAGSQGQWATFLPTNAALYYNITMNPAIALFFGWGSALLGFSFAAMVRPILIDDPKFVFPLSMQQVTVYRSIQGTSELHLARSQKQMRVFWIIFAVMFTWQFLPEFVFPFVAALAPLCWFAPHNHKVNFLGAGRGGVGLLNITLDWTNITSTVITYPYSVQITIFASFVIMVWILIPIAYFGNLWGSPTWNIMSNGVFLANGTTYPFNSLLDTDASGYQVFNETRYEEIGLAYSGAQYLWNVFMWYASYISSFVWCGLFLAPTLKHVYKSFRNKRPAHTDRLSRLIAKYPKVTWWEWGLLSLIPFFMLLGVILTKKLYMSTWTYFVGLGFGAAAMLPMSLVYAQSGYSMKVGIFNELIYGYMIEAPGSSRHPLGQLAYRIISGNVWYDARTVLEDQKIGHYFHIPPRQVIGIQVLANMLAIPVNYGVMRWVIASKFDYVSGKVADPAGQWTGQEFKSYNSAGVQYSLVGPTRLFKSSVYQPLTYGFLVGAIAPVIVWLLHKRFPKVRFDLFNTTIFFSGAATFYGNLSTGPFTTFIVGTVWNFYLYRYRRKFWNTWAYISGAALDTGFNFNLLFIFIFLGTTGVAMKNWWGNNEDNIERCFALSTS
ncbi:OPT family small oligopeptide transporter [Cryptococcus amylolentus CBS 6039]|uniref:OPT family small oligopeptide transporter n=2 Tax=Cryptococcus amylolentus TaxID=104669 RepID=A0A1E3HAI0_9TREE|nr:OPT family small oligopeptide transporter [Cryptococcus amylolentus CBS 6039]ODN73352.1 OPT family small oligopeptide transporter [Cryptococcus amylolentus CBS 6039]ODN99141.1 OPT family small oligopeptide transporter [Cryptococcus amylolentus CBS 6273]